MRNVTFFTATAVFLALGVTVHADIAYVSTGNHIERYDSSGHDLGAFYTGASNWLIDQMAFAPTGDLYAIYTIPGNSTNLLDITPNGIGTTIVNGVSNDGIAVDSSGRVYVGGFGFIERYNSNGTGGTTFVSGLGNTIFDGLAFDSAGNLFASATSQNVILKITPGGSTSFWNSGPVGFATPTGVALDVNGQLYVSNGNPYQNVGRFDSNGVFQGGFGSGGQNGSYCLAFGSGGQLFAAETSGNIVEWTNPGDASPSRSVFVSGLTSPQDIVFTDDSGQPLLLPGGVAAVPETSTWMVSALAAVMLGVQFGRTRAFSKKARK
jgi:hypothetical protein